MMPREGIVHRRDPTAALVLLLVMAAGCLGPAARAPEVSPVPATAPVPWTHPPTPLYFFSLAEMQQSAAPEITLGVPTYLPDGFFFSEGAAPAVSGTDPGQPAWYSLTYRRGQDEWITLRDQSRNTSACSDERVYRSTANGQAVAGTGELHWGGDGWCYALSGTLPGDEMERIAGSVRLVPFVRGVIPPYEYQPPAHPLIRTLAVNRSVTEKDVTITVESLDCTAKACEVVVRLGISSPPAFSVPQGITAPPVPPEPHAEWRIDGGRLLRILPGNGGYRPEGATTLTFWKIEPIPAGSHALSVNFTRIRDVSGHWEILVPLGDGDVTGQGIPVQRDVA